MLHGLAIYHFPERDDSAEGGAICGIVRGVESALRGFLLRRLLKLALHGGQTKIEDPPDADRKESNN